MHILWYVYYWAHQLYEIINENVLYSKWLTMDGFDCWLEFHELMRM